MRLDLHLHTTASDGAWSPTRVVEGAARGGLHVIAIADHDTTAGVAEAQEAGRRERVQVIPALEVSSTWRDREIHVLGYFVDPDHPDLVAHRGRAEELRRRRMKEMVDRLADDGVEVPFAEVEEAAGPDAGALARPHLAKVLVAHGHVGSVPAAFHKLIGDDHPAFVPTRLMSPVEAVAMIHRAGGLASWAHPPRDLLDELLPELVDGELDALEIYRASNKRNAVVRLEGLARSHGLLRTGGSDWHTPDSGWELGDFHVTADEVEHFLDRGGL